jgi:uncharacterized membrane protein HdeD (DUF308 family)
MRANARA